MDSFIADETTDNQTLLEWIQQGKTALCPRCRAELGAVLSKEEAARRGVVPSVWCPVNKNHFCWLLHIK
jgi:hypothetical protein